MARDAQPVASRCGVVSTSAVSARTTLLVARFRYHLQVAGGAAETILCEEIVPLACTGPAEAPQWLTSEEGEALLAATAGAKSDSDRDRPAAWPAAAERCRSSRRSLAPIAVERAAAQLAAHERVREASRTKGRVTIRARAARGHPRGLRAVAEARLTMAAPQPRIPDDPVRGRPAAAGSAAPRARSEGAISTARGQRTTACLRASD